MTDLTFKNARILVVGGAGFVGSNLVHQLLEASPKQIVIVDNLLSSDVSNIPDDKRVHFVFGSITDDRIYRLFQTTWTSSSILPATTATSRRLPTRSQIMTTTHSPR